LIGIETLTGILEIAVTAAILFAIWKFLDKAEEETARTDAKR
jgi:hypothetical protein